MSRENVGLVQRTSFIVVNHLYGGMREHMESLIKGFSVKGTNLLISYCYTKDNLK